MHRVRDLDDLAVFRAKTSAQTAAEHINVRSIHLLCRPPQARTAAVTHLPSAPSAHPVPVWRAGVNTKTRDYRTFESARRAQTTCAPAHQQARKQAPQSVAQWLLPFSRNVPPRSSSCAGRSKPCRGLAGKVDEIQWRADRLRVQIFSAGSRQGDLKSNFRFSGNFVPVGQFFAKIGF